METNFTFDNSSSNGSIGNSSNGSIGNTSANFVQYASGNRAAGVFFQKFLLPWVVLFGLIGNSISAGAFLGKELRKISSSVYVVAVLISDNGVLVTLFFVWLEILGVRINSMDGICQFMVYCSYIFCFLSVWFVVCITVENYITICHPTRINTMCTVQRATIVTISLILLACFSYLPSIFSTEVVGVLKNGKIYKVCIPSPTYKLTVLILAYGDSIVTLMIPLLLIFLMLLAISLAILKSLRQKRHRSVATNHNEKLRKKSIPQVRVAKMLYILSLTFFILNVPSHVNRISILFGPNWTGSEEQAIIQICLQFIYYTNFAIKFFLFVSCSKNFRKTLTKKFCVIKSRYRAVERNDTVMTSST